MLTVGVFLLAGAIFVLAVVLYWNGWKLIRVIGVMGMVLERVANRAAAANGQPPITTKDDLDKILNSL